MCLFLFLHVHACIRCDRQWVLLQQWVMLHKSLFQRIVSINRPEEIKGYTVCFVLTVQECKEDLSCDAHIVYSEIL